MKKFTLGTVAGFLNHHVADLQAVSALAQGLLAAVPVNAETRASINQAITRVDQSATNITNALRDMDKLVETDDTISQEEAIKRMVADYMATHPQVGGVTPQVDASAATAAKMGDDMQAGDRSGAQQAGKGGETVTATEPLPGVKREEEAPAPSSETDAEKKAVTE